MRPTGERVVVEDYLATPELYLIYLFHAISYRFAQRYTKDSEVLDYGCGSGYGAASAAVDAAGVVGVDISPSAIAHARTQFGTPGLEFEVVEAERPLPFHDCSFDTVLSFQVIEHVRDPAAYLSEACRVLRPGGHLVLTTPDRRTRLLPGQRPWNRWHLTEYSERTLRRLLTPHFEAVELLGMSGRGDVLEIELRRTRRARWMTLPATLPIYPDRLRVRLLEGIQRLRPESGNDRGENEPADFGFDESALRIAAGARPAVNLVAVARR